ncbi:hypothetical protein Tco_0925582 [Tanacetum coccineum]|uniref:Uncharacterized protein n=1 Tax=Tanacetum coccineum TaxID=301880 RepID=A0ABQ5D989_9ASTR
MLTISRPKDETIYDMSQSDDDNDDYDVRRMRRTRGWGGGETMKTVNQGTSVEEIERVVAQQVANAIEAIAIYETKTNMARRELQEVGQMNDPECRILLLARINELTTCISMEVPGTLQE